ncbi:hypothetical protein JCGZ_24933 [Jatropha curcas]|uniref:RING-type E3 ubiquitin transferase n=1 Tax=Jatropha curcas TaxID=180498 RepID=A0A067L9Y9_JATCU|nr:RING-H2 finger protein ATL52 [Jatropha curcas]KDP40934.1 hypothetical protein JCGZ_24933 [Jatropha curcas]
MDFRFRKLLSEENETCSKFCVSSDEVSYYYCQGSCWDYCKGNCVFKPSPPPIITIHHQKSIKFLITGIVLASVFLLVAFYAFYVKFYSRRRRTEEREEQRNEIHEEFLDEDHGPIIDHPIWYINTVGLQPSVINSISVCKYKRTDGLVEGTGCSVCLNEFQEDETLRLLPKCSHAFHIPCIDTWLRSHTNCPNCRAPIVINPNSDRAASSETNVEGTSNGEETRTRVPGTGRESDEIEDVDGELRSRTDQDEEEEEVNGENRRNRVEDLNGEKDGLQPIRRSVSLDSLSAFKISQGLAIVDQIQSDRNSRTEHVKQSESSMGIVSKRFSGNQSLSRFMASSSIARSLQIGPSSLKRSISCGGKLFLSRYTRNSSSVLPL